MKSKSVISMVGFLCPPGIEDKFNKWYEEVHIPMLLKFKGVKSVRRYKILKASGDNSNYIAIYDFDSKEDFEAYEKSPELAAAREDAQKMWKDGGPEMKFRAQYELIRE